MKNFILLIIAIVLTPFFFLGGYSYHLYREVRYKHKFSMSEYNVNVAYQIDVLGCALVYNVRGHTLSAMAFEKDHWWFTYVINLMFWDKHHSYDQWLLEFNKGK